MALDQKFFKKSTTASGLTNQEQGLVLHLDANDVDSYDGDGSIWYDINGHEVNIPLIDKADNLQLHLNASDTTSYGGSGSTWTDISQNTNNATKVNGPTYGSDLRGYFDMDGSDDIFEISYDASLYMTANTGFAIEAWVNRDSDAEGYIIASRDATNYPYALQWNSSSHGYYGWICGSTATASANVGLSENTTNGVGNWDHVVITQSSSDRKNRLYVNGTLTSTSSAVTGVHSTSSTVYIGAYHQGAVKFNGKIGVVRIYNLELTADQVGQNFRAGNFINYSSIITSKHEATLGDIYTSNLQFDLDANNYTSGSTLTDAQGNHNGAITNATHTNDNNSDYFVLDGSDDYITIAHNNLFHMTADCSWEFLIKRNSTTNEQQIAYYGSGITYGQAGSNTRWFLNYATQSGYGFYFYNYDTASYVTSGNINGNSLPGEYEHLIITWDVSAKKYQFYYNGVLTENLNVVGSGTVGDHSVTNEPLYLGRANGYTGQPALNGNFAIARFYTSTLNATQVLQNYNAIKPLYKNVTALIDYRPDQYSGSGTSITNLGSLSNNAVLTGGIESTYDKELGDFFTIDGSSNSGDGIETTSNVTGVNLNTDGFSWELWINIAADSYSYIASFNYNSTYYNFSYRSNTDTIMFFNLGTILNTPTLQLNRWYHVVGTANSAGTKLYTDGVLSASNTTAAPNYNLDDKIYFGTYHSHSSADHIHTGPLGDARFYKGALTAEQVAQNYLATKNKYTNDNNATITGASWNTNSSPAYNYFTFDGSNDKMEIVHSGDVQIDGPYTWMFWFRPHSTNSGKYLMSKVKASPYGQNILLQSSNVIRFTGYSSGGYGSRHETATSAFTDNVWQHLAITIEGNSSGDDVDFFINGSQVSHSTGTYSSATLTQDQASNTSNSNLFLGAYQFGSSPNHFFDGDIGYFKCFKKQLSSAEVLAEYNSTKGKYGL